MHTAKGSITTFDGWRLNCFEGFTQVFPCFLNESSVSKLPPTIDDSNWMCHDQKRHYVYCLSSIDTLLQFTTNITMIVSNELPKVLLSSSMAASCIMFAPTNTLAPM
jgi:hypothetical protein